MTQDDEWPKRLTKVIADQVQRLRGERKMSAQQLADATAALGLPIARSVIANLESGRRDTVSVAELLVLARALRVPPLLLIFPVGQLETVELLPGEFAKTWDGARWLTGEMPMRDEVDEWKDGPITLFRDHSMLVEQWMQVQRPDTDAELHRRTQLTADIRRHRAFMRRQGLEPGQLPSQLHALIENEAASDGER